MNTMDARAVPTSVRAMKREATTADTQALVGSALTIVLPIIPGREKPLEALLNEIGTHIVDNPHIDFSKLSTTHFLRWVVIPPATAGAPSQLAFESNYDGTAEAHLSELLRVAPAALHKIYSACTGYPRSDEPHDLSQRDGVVAFLLDQALPYAAFYVGVPGASAKQIRSEAAIRLRLQMTMDRLSKFRYGGLDPLAICEQALRDVRSDPELSRAIDLASDRAPIHPLRLAAGAGVALAASPILIPALLAIRFKELTDQPSPQIAMPDEALALMAREDLQIQNQLTHVVPLRVGLLRKLSVNVVLKAIDLLAQAFFTRGNLGGITSIHFARWVEIDDGKRLLFFSNYDGSWESYLGDFIDKAAVGLTAVWSNTQGFPKTFFLLFKGATDEERFKAWTRKHQVPTQLWYSAYPDLTVKNILQNRKICTQLRRGFKTRREAESWLKRL
jgi:hypothetical protein